MSSISDFFKLIRIQTRLVTTDSDAQGRPYLEGGPSPMEEARYIGISDLDPTCSKNLELG